MSDEQKITLRRQSGFPLAATDKEAFRDLYRVQYDEIHKNFEDKIINIEQYQELVGLLHDKVAKDFIMTISESLDGTLKGVEDLIRAYEAPILMVINADTGLVEGVVMDNEEY